MTTSPGSGSTTEAVKAARNPQEAMLAIAQGIDAVLAKLDERAESDGYWTTHWDGHYPTSVAEFGDALKASYLRSPIFTTEGDDEHVEVNIRPVTDPGRLAERRALAHAMELDDNLPHVEDAIDVYVKGGPIWLYTGNREFVMSLPMAMRQQMVLDVEQDDHQTAHEMGRDLLKDPSPGELPSLSGGD